MINPITNHERYLQELKEASENLARANGLLGSDSMLRDSRDKPLEFGAASTNAIAHALSSAYLAYDHSPIEAALLGWAREHNSYWREAKRPAPWDTFKDLYNNQVGRNIAEYARRNDLSREQIQDLVLDALSSGKLIVTQKDPRLDASFNGNPFNYSSPEGDGAPWTRPSQGFSGFAPTVTRVPVASPNDLSGQASPSSIPRPPLPNLAGKPDHPVFDAGARPAPFVPSNEIPSSGESTFEDRLGHWYPSLPSGLSSTSPAPQPLGLLGRLSDFIRHQNEQEDDPSAFDHGARSIPFVPDIGEGSFADRFGDRPPVRRLSSRWDRP